MSLTGAEKLIRPNADFKLVREIIDEYPTMERFINQSAKIRAEYEKYKTFEILNDKYGKR